MRLRSGGECNEYESHVHVCSPQIEFGTRSKPAFSMRLKIFLWIGFRQQVQVVKISQVSTRFIGYDEGVSGNFTRNWYRKRNVTPEN
jgi:hypothetical protein